MTKCPSTVAFNSMGNTTYIFCGTWACPRCRSRIAGRWAKRTELGLASFAETGEGDAWFLTLTLGSLYRTPQEGYAAIPRLWDTTRKAYQRYYGSFTYLAFVEGQAKRGGMPHFHIVTPVEPPTKRGRLGYVTRRGVHDFAVAYGWGYQAKLELVTGSQAAVYVSKYTSKGDPSMPRNFRRVRASRDFPKLPDLDGLRLLVPSRGEDIDHFIDRVSFETGVNQDDLYPRWAAAQRELPAEREQTDALR